MQNFLTSFFFAILLIGTEGQTHSINAAKLAEKTALFRRNLRNRQKAAFLGHLKSNAKKPGNAYKTTPKKAIFLKSAKQRISDSMAFLQKGPVQISAFLTGQTIQTQTQTQINRAINTIAFSRFQNLTKVEKVEKRQLRLLGDFAKKGKVDPKTGGKQVGDFGNGPAEKKMEYRRAIKERLKKFGEIAWDRRKEADMASKIKKVTEQAANEIKNRYKSKVGAKSPLLKTIGESTKNDESQKMHRSGSTLKTPAYRHLLSYKIFLKFAGKYVMDTSQRSLVRAAWIFFLAFINVVFFGYGLTFLVVASRQETIVMNTFKQERKKQKEREEMRRLREELAGSENEETQQSDDESNLDENENV